MSPLNVHLTTVDGERVVSISAGKNFPLTDEITLTGSSKGGHYQDENGYTHEIPGGTELTMTFPRGPISRAHIESI